MARPRKNDGTVYRTLLEALKTQEELTAYWRSGYKSAFRHAIVMVVLIEAAGAGAAVILRHLWR